MEQLAPSGARARIQANLEALSVAAGIVIDGAPLTTEAQQVMGRYGGWGAADAIFAPGANGNDLRDRDRLRAVLARLGGSEEAGERFFRSAGLTVLNAHYTDPMLVGAIYRALADLGLVQGTVVEPGAGSGQFAAFAPAGIRITGIELDPATALIAQLLHPDAEILTGSVSDPRFARIRDQSAAPVRVPRDTADGFVGNVPFSEVKWPDEVLNPGPRFSLHDHAIRWGVTRVAPGGLCAFVTSRYTADAVNPRFRRTLAGELDLIGMVRLPSTAHKRMAGTSVVTDIIIGRRIADGQRPLTSPQTWEQSRPLAIPGSSQAPRVNTYFHDNPQHILGNLQAGGMYRADDFTIAPSGDLEQQLGAALGEITGRALAAGQRWQPRPAARPVIEILSRRPDGTITTAPDGTFTQVVHGQDIPLVISGEREADQTRRLVALAEARSTLISAEATCPEDTDEIDAMRASMGELYDAYTAAYGPIGRFTTRTVTYHVKTLEGVLDRLDFSRKDVPDPEVTLLEAYLGRHALTRIVNSVANPEQVRQGTRKDKQGETVTTTTQLVEVAKVRAALMTALGQIPRGADADTLTATFGERMSRIEKGEQRTRLMPAAFRSDPRRPAVEALETFDPVTQTATKKAVFSRRTAMPHRMELGADTPQEALDLVLIHRRSVDLGEIARLLGTDEAEARTQLATLVFDDPATGTLVAASEYLSGNVREKLDAAHTAAAGDPERFTANVESLQAVQPPALAAEDIQARLGSAWLSREMVQEGLRYVLEDPRLTVIHPGGSEWRVESRTARNSRAQDTYGTSDWNALDLAEALLTNASITVRRTTIDPVTGDEKSYRDDGATLFAFRKAQRLDADFVAWLWSDPVRADECVRLYNTAYNNQVKRIWDSSPFYIPGLAPGMKLHPFQNAMVRRLHTESGLAAWVVGAGKTELGIVAAMEGARLGRHRLTAIVTPASLVNQWRDRIYRTFPEARVLVADDDLRGRKDARPVFTERAASGDYQLAIVPYEFFGSLTLSADAARASVDEEIDKLTRYAEQAAAQGDRYTAKELQGKIAKLEAKYSAAVKASGGAAGFTDTGIDSVVVDEWHNFRRIKRDSNNRLLAVDGSGRANHMLAVFDYLRKRHPEGLRLGLSGTPLEQSIADAWAAMRFFTPERLKALGLEEFDAFLTTFGRTEPRREPTPTGSGLHVRERQADWFNLPDMRRTLWDPFADVVRRADLGLNLPRLAGGRPQTHVLPQTPGQSRMQADIDHRYELFKAGDREGDNHILKLMDQAAKNALHPRMLGMDTDGKIKLEVWADDAAAWYHATKDAGFLDRDGNPHPVPGALRMVACELGVPDAARPNAWSVYSEMRSLLAARGVPAQAIRFAQDADSDRKKAALWEDARTGRCNFVIGSAQTAGTGVDVPDRLQVLDYMTLSWNPTQFEQWLGRIVRQGNQNAEVAAHVWATEGTIEVLRADKIAMKSAPFEALLDGTSDTRRLTEEDDNPISAWAAEMTARMSGNPLLTAQREAQLEVDVAQGMQSEWQRENGVKARRISAMDKEIQELQTENAAIDDALGRAVDTRGDKFAALVGTGRYTVRAEAGAALIAALAATSAGDVSTLTGGNPQHLAELAGFPVTARYNRITVTTAVKDDDGQDGQPGVESAERTLITLGLEGVPQGQVGVIDSADLPERDPAVLVTSLEDRIRRLPGHKAKNTAAIADNRDQIAKTRAELAKPSPYVQQLADARDALDRIEAQISEQIKDDSPAPDAAGPEADAADAVPAAPATSDSSNDETADGDHPNSPDSAEVPDVGQASPEPGLSGEDLDFAYRHAFEYALGTGRDPGGVQEERALDYATWYLAAHRDEESLDDLPDHRYAWTRFADQGYPSREPAGTGSGRRDQDHPETEVTAEAIPVAESLRVTRMDDSQPVPAEPDAGAGPPRNDAIAVADDSHAGEHQAAGTDAALELVAPTPGQSAHNGQGPVIADGSANGLVIEHHQRGTLVHGTSKQDLELRRLLHQHGFKWSGNLDAWYLPRPWGYSTRDRRVTGLTASLRQAHRSFTMRGQQPATEATAEPAPGPLPAAQPYDHLRQAQADHSDAVYDYWDLTRTPAGNNALDRPDGRVLDAAYRAVHVSWHAAFAGEPQQVSDRLTAWAQAGNALARHLADEQYRAPRFRETLDKFVRSATQLASRTQATAQAPATWARVFADVPGNAPSSDPDHAATQPQADLEAATADETAAHPGHEEPADDGPASPAVAPLANMDLAAELDRMPGAVFARWLSMRASPSAGDLAYQQPGAGGSVTCDERGIEITVSGPEFTRHGLVTWPQAASWIDKGVTPARLGMVLIADRLAAFCRDHRDQLIVAGTCDPDATAAELGQIRDTAVAMIVDAALRSRGAAVPVPPARPDDPAWYTAAMITRPDRGAGKAENAALERLTQLRTLIRDPQPATAAEIRATLRHRIGYSLADLVRALDDPAAVRAWINGQAGHPAPDGYDSSGERWYGTSVDGLITDRNGDDRAPSCIRWEDIPAWIQPGITSGLRGRLLAADDASSTILRRTISAAVRQDPGTAPSEEEEERARQRLRAAVDATWTAIEAAPPPSSADLDRARRDYRDWRPVQQTLFDDLPQDGALPPGNTRITASPQPRPAPAALPAPEPAPDAATHHPDADPPERTIPEHGQSAGPQPGATSSSAADPPRQDPEATAAVPEGPAGHDDPEPPQTPASNSDLAIALHSLSGYELTAFLTQGKAPAGHGSMTNRRDGLPDAGAHQHLDFDRAGVRITVRSPQFHRHGLISWPQVASWIDTGLTPARLGIIIAASGLHVFTSARRDELTAVGKVNVDAAIRELDQISAAAIDATLTAALAARDANAPVPSARSAKLAYRSMAMLTGPDQSATQEENAALARIAELGAAIRGTQLVTPADIRTAIRWWIGDSLPEYARALASAEAMRAWIRRQAGGPASRPGQGTYDNGRSYSASPEGLRISGGRDTRIAPWILWEEVPAWIEPGLSASLRGRLAAAESLSAPSRMPAAPSSVGAAAPADQADDPLPGPLREAINAAWTAIAAAPPPSPAGLDHARTLYRATGTVQQVLPGSSSHHQEELPAAGEVGEPADTPLGRAVPGTTAPQAGDNRPQPGPSWQQSHATGPAVQPGAPPEETASTAFVSGAHANVGPPQHGMSHTTEEDTMPAAPQDTPRGTAAASPTPDEASDTQASPLAAGEPVGQASAEAGNRRASPAAQPDDGADLLGELDRVLDAIIERNRRTVSHDSRTPEDFTDIRAAFTLLRNALAASGPVVPAAGYTPRPSAAAPDHPGVGPAATEPVHGPDSSSAGFNDIQAAFAELRRVLDLPAGGRHARGSALPPDPASSRLLDRAAEEAQACARWYQDTPEWQRITMIGRAARDLIWTIREAARDYWAEIRQDTRVRGFARTLTARVSLAVSGAAHALAARLERSGRGNTRAWRAASGLHRATATFADRIMRYTPPQASNRMADARRIIDDLGTGQRSGLGPANAAGATGSGSAQASNPVRLARASFIARPGPQAVPPAEPARRAGRHAGQHRRVGHGM